MLFLFSFPLSPVASSFFLLRWWFCKQKVRSRPRCGYQVFSSQLWIKVKGEMGAGVGFAEISREIGNQVNIEKRTKHGALHDGLSHSPLVEVPYFACMLVCISIALYVAPYHLMLFTYSYV